MGLASTESVNATSTTRLVKATETQTSVEAAPTASTIEELESDDSALAKRMKRSTRRCRRDRGVGLAGCAH